ncbi:hypothetical protein [Serratia marcescens]|uniref:MrpH family fimbial adhesin n=1 Tax=Serratia TaxID=613 RepID=UPI003BA1EAC4
MYRIDVNIYHWSLGDGFIHDVMCYIDDCWVGVGAFDRRVNPTSSLGEVMFRVTERSRTESSANILERDVVNSKIFPARGVISLDKRANIERVCLGVGFGTAYTKLNFVSELQCDVIPQPPPINPVPVCEIVGNMTLEHGSVANEEINGNSVKKTVALNCSSKANVFIYIQGGNKIELSQDGKLFSLLSVNDQNGGVNITVPAGSMDLKLKSTLNSKEAFIEGGDYSSAGILIMEVR